MEPSSSRSGVAGASGLPWYVRKEFEGYLDCGILARGFCRVYAVSIRGVLKHLVVYDIASGQIFTSSNPVSVEFK